MWGSKGRSGYGDSTIGGDYGSWDGVSPNGRQYKNEATMETRDLSGADYWHLRKQNRPTEEIPAELHMLNGKANIDVYGRLDEPKKTTKVPLRNRILPQSARVDKLRSEAIELELAFKAGEFTPEEYTLLRSVAFKKLHRAEELLKKAITPVQKEEETDEDSGLFHTSSGFSPQPNDGYASEEYEDVGVEFIDQLSETNTFKSFLKSACMITRKVIHLSHKARSYWNELKAV